MKKKTDKVICLGAFEFCSIGHMTNSKAYDANSDITGHEKVKTYEITLN